MQGMGDILICIVKQYGWPTPTTLPEMFERFPPPGEEGDNGDDNGEEEDTLKAPPNYE